MIKGFDYHFTADNSIQLWVGFWHWKGAKMINFVSQFKEYNLRR